MKNLSVKIIAVLLLNVFFASCELVDGLFPEEENYESFVTDVSQNSDFDLLAYAEEDQSFFTARLDENGNPELAVLKSNSAAEPFPIWFSSDGYPEKMVVEGFIFTFDNFTDVTFDMGIISPDGEVSVAREIPIPEEYQEFMQLKSFSWSDGFRWAGHIAGAVACGASIAAGSAATAATFGISAPAAVVLVGVGCASTAMAIAAEFVPQDIQQEAALGATAISSFSTAVSCVNPTGVVSCLAGVTSHTLTVASAVIEENENEAALAEGAVEGGFGDIQVTLTWDSGADIDLYVQDPLGEWIWYNKKTSNSGGWLDVDDTNGYGPENIFWEKNSAPEGTYQVYVKHYAGGSANYSVLVQAFGHVKQFEGYIGRGEEVYITDFSRTHLKSGRIDSTSTNLPIGGK